MKHLLLTAAFLAAAPAHAGGPVIEETHEAEPQRHDRKVPGFVWIALGAVVAAAILGGGGDNCTAPEPEPQPETGPCP